VRGLPLRSIPVCQGQPASRPRPHSTEPISSKVDPACARFVRYANASFLRRSYVLQPASKVIFGDQFPLRIGRVSTLGRALRPRTFSFKVVAILSACTRSHCYQCLHPSIFSSASIIMDHDRLISPTEIQALVADGQLIVIHEGNALKLDGWINKHPGGHLVIHHMVGRDATDEINV
jgi:hypothetical protein